MTPQAVPKTLKFRFDGKTLVEKGYQKEGKPNAKSLLILNLKNLVKIPVDTKVEGEITDEENVVDDSEEQSCYVVGNYQTYKKKMMQFHHKYENNNLTLNQHIQTEPMQGIFLILGYRKS